MSSSLIGKAVVQNPVGVNPVSSLSSVSGSSSGSGWLSGLTGLVGSGVGLISSLFSNAVNYKRQKKLNKQNYEYNKALSELAYQHNLDMSNRQNEYNSPASQMARLKEAGLNPHLVYGNGSVENTSSSFPELSYQPYKGENSQFVDPIGNLMTGQQVALNAELQSAQIDSIQAQTAKTISDTKGVDLDNYIKRATMGQQILHASKLNALLSGQIRQLNLNNQDKSFYNEFARELYRAQLNVAQLSDDKVQAEIDELQKRLDLDDAQISQLKASARQLGALAYSLEIQNSMDEETKNMFFDNLEQIRLNYSSALKKEGITLHQFLGNIVAQVLAGFGWSGEGLVGSLIKSSLSD